MLCSQYFYSTFITNHKWHYDRLLQDIIGGKKIIILEIDLNEN